jgi:signal transduction histidine kinase
MDDQPTGPPSARGLDLERRRRLERGLVLVRAVGALLGLYLVTQSNAGPPPHASDEVVRLGYALVAGLLAGDIVVLVLTERLRTARGLGVLGEAAFALDAAVIFGLAWAYSYDPKGPVWVVIYILPLEGAIRYQLRGAIVTVALTALNETVREVYLAHRFAAAYPFLVSNVLFRVGIQGLIAAVAGLMARSLDLQAERAAGQAAVAERSAAREAEARRELAAFNAALLTGVAAEDLESSVRLMAQVIGEGLGFETFTILLREGDGLIVKGTHGLPAEGLEIDLGQGVTGTVGASGRALAVADVRAFEGYVEVDPATRSEMAAPMRIGEEVIGVVDVESRTPDAFDQASLELLERLAGQVALVVHSNRLLSQQRETMQRLQDLDQMKSDFVAITSHELRTPITAIRGFVKTALRSRAELAPEQLGHFMEIIDRQSARLARLVEDLLFVSRIEAGTIRFAAEPVDLQGMLDTMAEQVGPARRMRVRTLVQPEGASVRTDPHRLEQIVRNLVENALKFSPEDLAVDVEAMVRDDWYQIVVIDRGVGIAREELPRIFDRFHQAGEAMTREAEGAGLGLYITKRLVEAMGGTITVTSVPDEGSTFRVWLPVSPPSEDGRSRGSLGARESAARASARAPEAP